MIDSVFSVRRQVEISAHVSACTLDLSRNSVDSFHQYGLEQAQAFIFAIHLANQRSNGTTFGYRIRDSCGEIPSKSELCSKPSSLATILGPFWTVHETEDRSRVQSLYYRFSGDGTSQRGVVMCGLDRQPASGDGSPPSVVYLQQSCASQGQATVEFILEAKWQFVSVIGSTDSCGISSVERFYTRAKELTTDCRLSVSYYSAGQYTTDKQSFINSTNNFKPVKLEYDDVPNYLLGDIPTDGRLVVVLLANTETTFNVLRQMKLQKVDMNQFVFVFGEFWGNPDMQQRLNHILLDYLPETTNVKLQRHQKGTEMFHDYMASLKPYSNAFQQNKWLKEYIEGFYNCSIANGTCTDSDTWPTTTSSLFRNHHTSLIIDGVLAVAEYCRTANCEVRDGVQPHFDVARFHPDFTSWTGNRVKYGSVGRDGNIIMPLSWRYDFLGFRPTSSRSDFNFTTLGYWKRRGDQHTIDVQTKDLWKPQSYVFGRDCFPTLSLFLLSLPSIVTTLTIAVSCGLCFHKEILSVTLKIVYMHIIAVISGLSGLIVSVLVVLGHLPTGDCEDLAVDFTVTVISTTCFASILVTILCHRWNCFNTWSITDNSRFRILRYVSPAAVALAIIAGQVALSTYSCIVASPTKTVTSDIDSSCASTRDLSSLRLAYAYSTVVCFLGALASLLPLIESQNSQFRHHTVFSKISLFSSSILFASLVTSYLVVDSYSIHLSLLAALAVFPGFFIFVVALAVFLHVRWCAVHLSSNAPIIIELIDPLTERTADVFPNKYASTSTTLSVSPYRGNNPRSSTISRFPFQLRDQDLVNQVRPVFINPDRITIGEYIGGGNFGQVFNGALDRTTGVALKTLRGSFTAEELEDFLKEGLRMKDFDHPNVMQLIGIGYGKVAVNQDLESSVDVMPVVVLPYMEMGDLKRYLTEGRPGRARHRDVSTCLLYFCGLCCHGDRYSVVFSNTVVGSAAYGSADS
jgi:hypothetical protein